MFFLRKVGKLVTVPYFLFYRNQISTFRETVESRNQPVSRKEISMFAAYDIRQRHFLLPAGHDTLVIQEFVNQALHLSALNQLNCFSHCLKCYKVTLVRYFVINNHLLSLLIEGQFFFVFFTLKILFFIFLSLTF